MIRLLNLGHSFMTKLSFMGIFISIVVKQKTIDFMIYRKKLQKTETEKFSNTG